MYNKNSAFKSTIFSGIPILYRLCFQLKIQGVFYFAPLFLGLVLIIWLPSKIEAQEYNNSDFIEKNHYHLINPIPQ